jgi:hypothetical protein
LEERLETFRPTLVIIDSLRRINAGRDLSENSTEFGDEVYKLKELCAQYNAACLLIHHSSKNSEAVGVDRVRGSSAITSATWGIWHLDQIPKPDPNNNKKQIIDPKDLKRILSITSRDIEGQRLMIELDPDQNRWVNHGEVGVNPEDLKERKSQAAQAIELLKSVSPVGLEASEISQRLGIKSIYSVLNRLVGSKEIGTRPSTKDRRRSVYFSLTFDNNPPPPTDTDPNVIEYPETITIPDVQSSITFDHIRSQIDHNPPVVEECDQSSSVDGESITAYSITSSPLEGGEGVEESVELSHDQVENASIGVEKPAKASSSDQIDYAHIIRAVKSAPKQQEAVTRDIWEEEVIVDESTSMENAPQQSELPIYQRLDGNYEVQSEKSSNAVQVNEPPQEAELTSPETTPFEQLIIRLANVTTKEGFEAVAAGQSLETIQDAIDLQNTAPHRQLLKGFFNEVHHAK